jgi:hypothetical protein
MPTAPWPSAVTITESHPPLTTPWHVPESCTWTYDPTHTDSEAIAWLDLKPRAGDTTLSCYPSGMFEGNVWGVFSPASCPRGWTTVDVSVETGKSPEDALTTATCCSSYVFFFLLLCCPHSLLTLLPQKLRLPKRLLRPPHPLRPCRSHNLHHHRLDDYVLDPNREHHHAHGRHYRRAHHPR